MIRPTHRRRTFAVGPVGAAVLAVLCPVLPLESGADATPDFTADTTEDTITVRGDATTQRELAVTGEDGSPAATYQYRRLAAGYCGGDDGLVAPSQWCVAETGDGVANRTCADGTPALAPLYRREVDASRSPIGPWVQIDNGGCPEDPPAEVIVTATDFAALPLQPSPAHLQPGDGRAIVGMDLIMYTDPTPQVLETTILGVPVTITATPSAYSWDQGDGQPPLVTTDPGKPYPHQTVARPFIRHGDYAVTLTTTWTGTYRINGTGPEHPITGAATTPSDPFQVHVVEVHSHLVANP